jgi:membrane protein YdbS with pleckstrin-like domain
MAEEQVIFEGNIPMRAFHFSHGFFWHLFLGWNFGILWSWLQKKGHYLRITSQRISLIEGLISQQAEEVEFYRIIDTKFDQGPVQRILGVGEITIISDDETAPELKFVMTNPRHYWEQIRGYVRDERKTMRAIQVD